MNTHNRYTPLLIIIALLSLASLSCRLSEVGTAVPSPAPPSLPPFETYTPIPSPVVVAVNDPGNGSLPDSTESTPPIMTAKVDLNVRRGPSTQYPILTALRANEQVGIVGRSPDGFWWKVICPSPYGGECWSSARAEYSTAVNTQGVPVAAVPPLPTATATATATFTPTFTPTATATITPSSTPTATWTPTTQPTLSPPSYP